MLQSKSLVKPEELRATVEAIQTRGQKALGPELVVKAWTDPAFKARLLQNANAAGAELGIAVGGLLHLLPVESLSSSGRKCLAWPRCGMHMHSFQVAPPSCRCGQCQDRQRCQRAVGPLSLPIRLRAEQQAALSDAPASVFLHCTLSGVQNAISSSCIGHARHIAWTNN